MPLKNQEIGSSLPIRQQASIVNETFSEIDKNRNGGDIVLKTPWKALNKALLGGFRFGNNILIAGPSGHGKSYMLTMLEDAFTSELNAHLQDNFKILHFGWEMSAVDETVRALVGRTRIKYEDILSCFTALDNTSFDLIKNELRGIAERPIYYVEKAGTKYDVMKTIYDFQRKFPDHKLIITMDHTLLTEYSDEQSEVELIAELGKIFMKVRKDLGCLTIMLGQFNDKIEDPRRFTSPVLHYPTKTDIHGSKQLYHAVDVVLTCYQPALLGIDAYGPKGYTTENLVACHLLKMRKGVPGLIRLRADFVNGTFNDWIELPTIYGTFND